MRHLQAADVQRAQPEALDERLHTCLGLRIIASDEDVGATRRGDRRPPEDPPSWSVGSWAYQKIDDSWRAGLKAFADGTLADLTELKRRAGRWLAECVHGVASRSTGEAPAARLGLERGFLSRNRLERRRHAMWCRVAPLERRTPCLSSVPGSPGGRGSAWLATASPMSGSTTSPRTSGAVAPGRGRPPPVFTSFGRTGMADRGPSEGIARVEQPDPGRDERRTL